MRQVITIPKLWLAFVVVLFVSMCVPPEMDPEEKDRAEQARLDSLRELRCPRLMSSAAEYYRNQDWEATVQIYREIDELGCDEFDPVLAPPEEIYLYYAIAHEYLGHFENSEEVLLKGLQKLPGSIDLRKRLAYSYKKQGKLDRYIVELEKIMDRAPDDSQNMIELSKVYSENNRYEDQIDVLRLLLEKDPNNEIYQGEMKIALEQVGEDPLDYIRELFERNPENTAYGLDFSDRLLSADRPEEAVDVLKKVIRFDRNSKIAYRKLAQAYSEIDDLENASIVYENLLKLDPRDLHIIVQTSKLYIELQNFRKALLWADKAIQVSKSSGQSFGQKGNVYYKAFQSCRSTDITNDDRIVASLAYKYFQLAEENNYTHYSGSAAWLKENETLFSRANWFMIDPDKQSKGYLLPETACYNWVEERLKKDPTW